MIAVFFFVCSNNDAPEWDRIVVVFVVAGFANGNDNSSSSHNLQLFSLYRIWSEVQLSFVFMFCGRILSVLAIITPIIWDYYETDLTMEFFFLLFVACLLFTNFYIHRKKKQQILPNDRDFSRESFFLYLTWIFHINQSSDTNKNKKTSHENFSRNKIR